MGRKNYPGKYKDAQFKKKKKNGGQTERGMEFCWITIQFAKLENAVFIGLWEDRNPPAMLVRM